MVLPVPQNALKFLIVEETENISIFVVSAMNDISVWLNENEVLYSVLHYDVDKMKDSHPCCSRYRSVINKVSNTNCFGIYIDNKNMVETYRWYCWQITSTPDIFP